jgi:hypothetical protein
MQPSGFDWRQLDQEISRLSIDIAAVEGRLDVLAPQIEGLRTAQQKAVAGLRAEAGRIRPALRLAAAALPLLRMRWEGLRLAWALRLRLAPLRLGLKRALWQERRRSCRLRIGR